MSEQAEKKSKQPIVVAAGVAVLTALAGGFATRIGEWYRGLEKPDWNPPDWLFAPAWTLIYALAVIAAVLGWRAARSNGERAWLASLFFVNVVLNVAWSFLFFTLQRPDWALAEAVTLFLSVIALIVFLARFKPLAAAILVPYLAWVGFATVLNYELVRLNGPFG
jgi:translocator protein